MKIRTDFVTNSSSSSFILSFKTQDDYLQFREYCIEYNFRRLFELIDSFAEVDDYTNKEKLIELYRECFDWDVCNKLEIYDQIKEETGLSMWQVPENDPILQSMLEQRRLDNIDTYNEAVGRIENSWLSVWGQIWDYDGGFMEWAIRDGFLLKEFPQYTIYSRNVG